MDRCFRPCPPLQTFPYRWWTMNPTHCRVFLHIVASQIFLPVSFGEELPQLWGRNVYHLQVQEP